MSKTLYFHVVFNPHSQIKNSDYEINPILLEAQRFFASTQFSPVQHDDNYAVLLAAV